MPAHKVRAALAEQRRQRACRFAQAVRHNLEKKIAWLNNTAETEEERRDTRRARLALSQKR